MYRQCLLDTIVVSVLQSEYLRIKFVHLKNTPFKHSSLNTITSEFSFFFGLLLYTAFEYQRSPIERV